MTEEDIIKLQNQIQQREEEIKLITAGNKENLQEELKLNNEFNQFQKNPDGN